MVRASTANVKVTTVLGSVLASLRHTMESEGRQGEAVFKKVLLKILIQK
jgi:hypothetical protein